MSVGSQKPINKTPGSIQPIVVRGIRTALRVKHTCSMESKQRDARWLSCVGEARVVEFYCKEILNKIAPSLLNRPPQNTPQ